MVSKMRDLWWTWRNAYLLVLYMAIILLSENLGHAETPKDSVVLHHYHRLNNNLMVMKLSPSSNSTSRGRRTTILSLKGRRGENGHDNAKSSGLTIVEVNESSKTRRHSAKPGIIFASSQPKPKASTSSSGDHAKDLVENQTETETNPSFSSESSVQNHDESPIKQSQQQLQLHQQRGPSTSAALESKSLAFGFGSENESPLSHFASLRGNYNDNASIDSQPKKNNNNNNNRSSSSSKRPELGQVWSSSSTTEEDANAKMNGAEGDEDFHTLIAGFLKREIWTIPLFVFASLNIVLITFFEVYVLCRTQGQSRGHLFLGQMLLFGLFFSSTLALLFAIYPTMLLCYVFRIGIGFGYSLIAAVLMTKAMFLLCLDVGVYLPTMYQGGLLFFSVMVQIVLDAQWTILYPPVFMEMEAVREESVFLQCGTSYSMLLYSLWYVGFLVLLVGLLSAKATFRGIAENYREAIYILMSVIVSVPIAISWILAGWILEGREQDACVAFGMVAHSLSVFLIMFMPKGRQLAAMGKETMYEEDDQFSRYSPSFFHYKPPNKGSKPPVFGGIILSKNGNLYTTLEPTLSTINPNVFFHRGDCHTGMIY